MASPSHQPQTNEQYWQAFTTAGPKVSYGIPFPEGCAKHVTETCNAKRVYIIASASLARNTNHVQRLQSALGDKVVGIRKGIKPHTPWSEILEITAEAKGLEADLLITLGAGSLTDGAKIVATAIANNARTFQDLDNLHSGSDWSRRRPDLIRPTIPIISIPTSLSGGEYSDLGGGTHDTTHQKHGLGHPTVGPKLVVLDPELTTTTPEKVWLSSGFRAVDHCVESLCSLSASNSKESAASAETGLRLLIPGLLKTKAEPKDLEARLACQKGVIEAMKGVFFHGVPMGASHGIGHQLGPLGVGHGETSCILSPAVCKYNTSANAAQQKKVCEILWSEPSVAELFEKVGLGKAAELGDLLGAVVKALGMPSTLKEVGVGEEKFDQLATNALTDHWVLTNPRPITTKEQVREVLEMVRGGEPEVGR
ncbi:hypothetical protein LTR78_009694 [Recurvomyces mirabilis]|uniref:Alcohol dehydrogenase iron-type/glycerol dehydrogenase GldA domain-containing protein n=1 Tax=Recurvomyces mirabilis TaxID=574656 RepID=A0AAE0TNA8_9PEZI|nr:hypothetical protein LTR78_009694 [Recurvomyces mirabilis]KAK5150264.1 hypothetical protein LTS14_010240 [Recurvomyces mirabilis]